MTTDNKLSISQLAVKLSMHRHTLSKKINEAQLQYINGPKNSKLYDLDTVVALVAQSSTTDLASEQLRLTTAKREKIELELAIKRSEYVSLDEVKSAVSQEYGVIRAQLLSLPSSVSKHISNLGSDVEKINQSLTKTINDILQNLQADALDNPETVNKPE